VRRDHHNDQDSHYEVGRVLQALARAREDQGDGPKSNPCINPRQKANELIPLRMLLIPADGEHVAHD